MAKNEPKYDDFKADEPQAATAPSEFAVSLDNFCTDLSKTDKRVELIGGFHFTERVAGRTKDTPKAYAARFEAFVTRPA